VLLPVSRNHGKEPGAQLLISGSAVTLPVMTPVGRRQGKRKKTTQSQRENDAIVY
jgi:hypothetical protein